MNKLVCAFLVFLLTIPMPIGASDAVFETGSGKDFRAVWVSSVLNLDFPSQKNLTPDQMKAEIDQMINHSAEIGLNAIILQVRPCADALYNSSIFPWSEYLTGTQGDAPDGGFDPLSYWIEQAHKKGLELHAWINPYRITHTSAKITDANKLSAGSPARKNPSWVIVYKDALYFDPGLPEARKLIVDGITEIIKNYNVDGIHLDDYFYPGTDFPDSVSFQKYGAGKNLGDWRRDNVNELIKTVQKTVRELNPKLRFGVSPFAIWKNSSTDPLGSDTRGGEAYVQMFADTRTWVKEGWLDYICPQIYWYIGFEKADYKKVLEWWVDVCKNTSVDLYIGHAAYREAEKEANWSGEIVRQLNLNKNYPAVKGDVFFRSGFLKGAVGQQIKDFFSGAASEPPSVIMSTLAVNQPAANVTVNASGYNIMGTCDPSKPLFINGDLVENRTAEGFFSTYVKLDNGDNTFRVAQEGKQDVVRIIKSQPSVAPAPVLMKEPSILNAFPQSEEYIFAGSSVTLRCSAPAGSEVIVSINREIIKMSDDNAAANSKLDLSKPYQTSYSCTYTPAASGSGVNVLGTPAYSAVYNGKSYKATASQIKVINEKTPYYATVSAEASWLYPDASTNKGSSWQVVKGQKDIVTAVSKNGSWVRLGCGKWLPAENVVRELESSYSQNVLSGEQYLTGKSYDVIKWNSDANTALDISYSGNTVTIAFGPQNTLPKTDPTVSQLVSNTIFGSVSYGDNSYNLVLRDGFRIEGLYTEFLNGELRVMIKKTRKLNDGDFPLTGFKFVIDAGHGQSDTGAIGPMGAALAEKHINLQNSNKLSERLEKLGATVVRVRDGDNAYSLEDRTAVSRLAKPDMFISLHSNSLDSTVDASNVHGLTVWYRNENSRALADTLTSELYYVNPLTTRREESNQSNFYVCRPLWTPSVIVEASFMCNADDFSWLINENRQNELADKIVEAILTYYGKI